ncbi:uncharacterized protein LOC111594155 [Drosophila hydei]|uniref:Uncharacterized protein LOC111594155 n=1 Tax=Drosophila hydei TaxID=7224 RepID=A0A6J1LAT4_DROHY|nr:uncharacterized protein LOC111594155 [Drosophila hydei]
MLKKLVIGSSKKFGTIHLPKAKLHACKGLCRKDDRRLPEDLSTAKEDKCVTIEKRKCSQAKGPCEQEDGPSAPRYSCSVNKRIKKSSCETPDEGGESKHKSDEFRSMWKEPANKSKEQLALWTFPPECCPTCENTPFDVLYYRPSKKCRPYQRTWWECCPRMVPKRVCCWGDAIPPETERRCRSSSIQTPCSAGKDKGRKKCNERGQDCPRLTLACCRAARVPPSCLIKRSPKDCAKPKCPYPSFSECKPIDLAVIPGRAPECRCKNLMSICDSVRVDHRKDEIGSKFCDCPTCK